MSLRETPDQTPLPLSDEQIVECSKCGYLTTYREALLRKFNQRRCAKCGGELQQRRAAQESLQRQLDAVDAVIGFPDGTGAGRIEMLKEQRRAAQGEPALCRVLPTQEAVSGPQDRLRSPATHQPVQGQAALVREKLEALHEHSYPLAHEPTLAWLKDNRRYLHTLAREALAALDVAGQAPEPQGWQPMETAPKDGTRIDIWAKTWRPEADDFIRQRFPDCYWTKGDSMTNRHERWVELDSQWHPTHWMPLPSPPKERP